MKSLESTVVDTCRSTINVNVYIVDISNYSDILLVHLCPNLNLRFKNCIHYVFILYLKAFLWLCFWNIRLTEFSKVYWQNLNLSTTVHSTEVKNLRSFTSTCHTFLGMNLSTGLLHFDTSYKILIKINVLVFAEFRWNFN